ncbi:hypothetical protein BH24ACI3_BH24ACI3_09130 [soil metagenome]
MAFTEEIGSVNESHHRFDAVHKALLAFGFVAPLLTFWFAISGLSLTQKTAGLIAVSIGYAAVCGWAFMKMQNAAASQEIPVSVAGSPTEAAEAKLLALDEANQFFGTSLKPADMFRLVSNRVRDIVPFEASALWIPNEDRSKLHVAYCDGDGAERLNGATRDISDGIAGLAFLSGEIEYSPEANSGEDALLVGDDLSSIAVPLSHAGSVFGIFQIYERRRSERSAERSELLNAVASRVAPLFLGSKAFERSLSNALTDPLTDLPNERAFFMILENQVAESQRFRDDRPVSILSIDIKGFEGANQMYGHGVGDQLLRFAGTTIRSSLRKMDFLARVTNDEFAVILPTASERVTQEIVERIRVSFTEMPFQISEHESVKLWMNFGWATFWKDGETSQQLIQTARLRKQQSKSEDPGNVLWFDKEYVN